jgi:hypothetical protein
MRKGAAIRDFKRVPVNLDKNNLLEDKPIR